MLRVEKIPASRAFLGRGASRCPFPYRSRGRVSPASDSASEPCAFSRRSHVEANLFRLSNRRGPEKGCNSSRFLTRIAFERKSKQARPCSETKRREGLPLGDDLGREGDAFYESEDMWCQSVEMNVRRRKDSCFPCFPRARRKPLPLSLTGQGPGSRLPLTAQASLALFPVGVTWKRIFLGFLIEEDLRNAVIRRVS